MHFVAIEQSARNGIAVHNKTHTRCHAFGIFPTKSNDLLLLVCAALGEDTFGMTPLGNLSAKAVSVITERPVGHGNSYEYQ